VIKSALLWSCLFGFSLLRAQPLLPNPVYGLQAAVSWQISGENGIPYGGTMAVGKMEGVPVYYDWYYGAVLVSDFSKAPNATYLRAYDQVYKVAGSAPHPNCRVELGPMRFMVHLKSTGQWTNMLNAPVGGAAFVEDFWHNESTGSDSQTLANWVNSVRAGIGNAQPTTANGAGGVDSRGVGFMYHGFPANQPQIAVSTIDACLAYQQMRCVGPDAVYTPYICNVGIDYEQEYGLSGGRFIPMTTNWQWVTCYVGPTNLISTIPEPNAAFVYATNITISEPTATLPGGATLQLSATIAPTNASNKGLTWTSSNPNVAFVGLNGLVTALTPGAATIYATTQENPNLLATCVVTVTSLANYTVVNAGNNSDGITYVGGYFFLRPGDINGDERMMNDTTCYAQYSFNGVGVDVIGFKAGGNYGANYTIYVDETPRGSGNTSSGSDQFQVVLGSVTNLSNGQHTVKLAFTGATGGSPFVILDAFRIYTQNVPVTGVTVSPTSVFLAPTGTQQIVATVSPSNALNQVVSWFSSDTNIAIVSTNGVVTAFAAGTVTITATTQDGGYTANAGVTVTNPPAPSVMVVNAGNASDGIAYNGGWFNTRSGNVNNDERMMNNNTCYAQYTFNGIGVDVLGFKAGGSYGANYTIYLDGNSIATGNTTSATNQFQAMFGSATNLSNGAHTVKVAFTSGIGSTPYVILDALKIYQVAAISPPTITGPSMAANGTSFTVTGTGGAYQAYVLLGATNLTPPVAWVPLRTNTANGSGGYSLTDSNTANFSKRFYRVQQGQ